MSPEKSAFFFRKTTQNLMLGSKENTFIIREMPVDWFPVAFPIYHCHFDDKQYRDELFYSNGIQLPDSLKTAAVKRRAEFFAGRYCARQCLEILGFADCPVAMGNNREPVWPNRLVGAISHSKRHAVAAVSDNVDIYGVGVDMEAITRRETFERIKHKVAAPEELAFIDDFPGDIVELFTLIFSVKESFFKAAYPTVGHYFDFETVSMIELDSPSNSLTLKLNKTLTNLLSTGDRIHAQYRILDSERVVTLIALNHP